MLPVLIAIVAIVVDVGFWQGSYVGHRTQIIAASMANARARAIYGNWLNNNAYQQIAANSAVIASPATSMINNFSFSGNSQSIVSANAVDNAIFSKVIGFGGFTENLSSQTKSYSLPGRRYAFVSE